MSVRSRIVSLVLAGSLTLPLGGCLEGVLNHVGPLGFFMIIFSGRTGAKPAKAKKVKFKDKSDARFQGSYGGLSGTYDVGIEEYGSVSGEADIKGSFKAKIRDREFNADLAVIIESAALDRFGVEIDVFETSGKYKGRQTPGGVKKIFNGKVKFEGVVLSGEHAGSTVKGKMTAKGKFE